MDTDYLEKLGITMTQGRKGPNDKIFYLGNYIISTLLLGKLFVVH